MKNRFLLPLVIIIIIFFFVVFYKGLTNTNIYKPSLSINNSLPEFKTSDFFTSEVISSKNLFSKSDFYLINIWSSWCLPCKVEHPYLLKFQNEDKLKLIGINYKDQKKNATGFLKEMSNPFDRIINDKDGTISINLGAYGVPETFLVKNNLIIKKVIGPINEESYLEILNIINDKK